MAGECRMLNESTVYLVHRKTGQLNRAWYCDAESERTVRDEMKLGRWKEISKDEWLAAGGKE